MEDRSLTSRPITREIVLSDDPTSGRLPELCKRGPNAFGCPHTPGKGCVRKGRRHRLIGKNARNQRAGRYSGCRVYGTGGHGGFSPPTTASSAAPYVSLQCVSAFHAAADFRVSANFQRTDSLCAFSGEGSSTFRGGCKWQHMSILRFVDAPQAVRLLGIGHSGHHVVMAFVIAGGWSVLIQFNSMTRNNIHPITNGSVYVPAQLSPNGKFAHAPSIPQPLKQRRKTEEETPKNPPKKNVQASALQRRRKRKKENRRPWSRSVESNDLLCANSLRD